MVAKMCFNSSVGSFFICCTNVVTAGTSPLWGRNVALVLQIQQGQFGYSHFLPLSSKALSANSSSMIRMISVLGLSNFRSIWIPIKSLVQTKLIILVINSSLEKNPKKHSVGSLWLRIRPTGLSMSTKSRVTSSGWKGGISSSFSTEILMWIILLLILTPFLLTLLINNN